MIQLETIQHLINYKVINILKELDVNVCEFKHRNDSWSKNRPDVAGVYQHFADQIVINQKLALDRPELVNGVILHELIHWTGRFNRLNRQTLKYPKTIKSLHTEERLAQQGAQVMATLLGINNKELNAMTQNYILNTPHADVEYVREHGRRALKYIDYLFGRKSII